MKTREELNAPKEKVETAGRKLHKLTDEELAQVTGGFPLPGIQFPSLPDLIPPDPTIDG